MLSHGALNDDPFLVLAISTISTAAAIHHGNFKSLVPAAMAAFQPKLQVIDQHIGRQPPRPLQHTWRVFSNPAAGAADRDQLGLAEIEKAEEARVLHENIIGTFGAGVTQNPALPRSQRPVINKVARFAKHQTGERPLTQLRSFKDGPTGCFANIRMDNGDPCYVSVAQTGVIIKKSRIGMFGAKLYDERNVYNAAMTAKALDYLYNDRLTPPDINSPVLNSFTNAILHCSTLAEATRVINEAVDDAEKASGTPIKDLLVVPS